MSDLSAEKVVAEWTAAMEGVTPGPWRVDESHDGEVIGRPVWPCRRSGVDGDWRVAIADEMDGNKVEEEANAAWIARCSPTGIRSLLDLLAQQAARLEEALLELGKARLCVNCGQVVNVEDISEVGDCSACQGPDGLSACTFDVVPAKAFEIWRDRYYGQRAALTAAEAEKERLRGLLNRLVNAKAISGVRELVAGWNGEGRPDGPYPRHDNRLGATLPKTNCGQIYDLDDAMQAARAALSEKEQGA